jgi:ketosteroid isomerase-like protein
MKIRTIFVLAIGFVLLLWLSTPQKAAGQTTPVNENNTSSVKQDLEKRSLEYAEALTKRDLTTLDQIWTDDYVFINPRGELVTKSQRLSNLKAGATEFQAVRPKNERMEVHGNVALDVGTVTLEGTKYGGKESSGDYRYLSVWVNSDGRWQMVANQITRITH